jgi:hypothetical protein
MAAKVFLKLKKAKDANPKLWSAQTLATIQEQGDADGALQDLMIKRWKLGIEESCEAGAELHLFADEKVIGYRVFTADKNVQKFIDNMRVAVEGKLPKKAAPAKQDSAVTQGTDKAVTKTIKVVTAAGQVASVTVFVLSAAALAGMSLNPITAPLAALGLLNQAIGIMIGIAEKRKKWGTEVNKSALARLGEWGKEKLHVRRVKALKEKGGDSVAARADYCAVLQEDINKLKQQLNEFRDRADRLLEEASHAKKIADQAQAKIGQAEQEVQARVKAGQPIAPEDVATLETIAAKYDELARYKVENMLQSQDDLWGRGAPTINDISARIAEMEDDIKEATTGAWFANAARKLYPTGGASDGPSSRTAEVAAEESPETAMAVANIGVELAEVIGDFKVTGLLSILNELKGVAVSVAKVVAAAKEDRAKWDVMDKSITQKLEDWWNRRKEARAKAGTDPAAFTAWQQLATQHLADMKEELAKVKERQAVAEQVALNASTSINDLYGQQAEKVKQAQQTFEEVKVKSQRIVKTAQDFLARYKDLDPQEKQTLLDHISKADEAQAQMAKALADAQKNLAGVEAFCLKKKDECVNVLNEGLDQSINEKQKAIDDLQAELASAKAPARPS